MGRLIFAINVTMDGCCDHTKGVPDDEVHQYFADLTREVDVVAYGRKTYELMVPFWPDLAKSSSEMPKTMRDFAQAFVSIPQIVVFSQTLDRGHDKNTLIVRTEPEIEILKLKKDQDKTVLTGGVSLPSHLMKLGLVDEVRLVIQPVVAGQGRRLFDEMDLQGQLGFKLINTKVFSSGAIVLRYSKK